MRFYHLICLLLISGCVSAPVEPPVYFRELWECGTEVYACEYETGPPAGLEMCESKAVDETPTQPPVCG